MSGLSTAKLLFFFLSLLFTLKRSYYAYSIFKEWEVVFHFIQGKICIKLWDISSQKIYLSSFFCLFIQFLCQYGLMNIHFILRFINQFYIFFFLLSFCIDSSCSWLLHSFDPFSWFFRVISLLPGYIRCFRLTLCISCLSLRITNFSKECWFLLLNNGSRNTIWVLGFFFPTEASSNLLPHVLF